MIAELPVAFGPSLENVGRFIISALAVAGGAFLGGLLVGVVTQLLARLLTAKAVPRRALNLLRLLGGIAAGALVWMMLFGSGGGGGWGWGGGGLGPGKGNGGEPADKKNGKEVVEDKDKDPRKNGEPPVKVASIRVEVLGDMPDAEKRFFRLEGEPKLLTRTEVAEALSQRRKENPDLQRVVIVLYRNSPAEDTAIVNELKRAIEARGLTPGTLLEKGRAP